MEVLFLVMAFFPLVIGAIGIILISYYFYKWTKGDQRKGIRLKGEICFLIVLFYFFLFFLFAAINRSGFL